MYPHNNPATWKRLCQNLVKIARNHLSHKNGGKKRLDCGLLNLDKLLEMSVKYCEEGTEHISRQIVFNLLIDTFNTWCYFWKKWKIYINVKTADVEVETVSKNIFLPSYCSNNQNLITIFKLNYQSTHVTQKLFHL